MKNSMEGCGKKPTGGRVLVPVTKARIVPGSRVSSCSNGKAIWSKMAIKTKHKQHNALHYKLNTECLKHYIYLLYLLGRLSKSNDNCFSMSFIATRNRKADGKKGLMKVSCEH